MRPATVSQTDDALQITLGPSTAYPDGRLRGGVYVDVSAWDHRDWAHVVIRARSSGPGRIGLWFNVRDEEGDPNEGVLIPFEMGAERNVPLVGDSTVQTYQLLMEPRNEWEAPIEQLGVDFSAAEPLTVEIISITVVPVDATSAEGATGAQKLRQPLPSCQHCARAQRRQADGE
jgi:hypothetical protein